MDTSSASAAPLADTCDRLGVSAAGDGEDEDEDEPHPANAKPATRATSVDQIAWSRIGSV
jgi:hypothetical protein